MDFRRLRHFLAVFEHGSFGKAAEVLNLTQPALSKSIHKLEEDLGVRLFERMPTGVVPTVYGETLSHHAKVIQAEMHSAEREFSNLAGAVKGAVTVGIGPSIATNLMPLAAERLHEEHPDVVLTVIEGLFDDHIPALRRGEIDLAIGNWPQISDPNLACEPLMHDQCVVVAGAQHPLARRPVQIAEMLDYAWALPSRSQVWREELDQVFCANGLSPPVPKIVALNAAAFLRSLVLHNKYLTFLPRQVISVEEAEGLVCALDVDEILIDVTISVTYRERIGLTPACKLLISIVKEIFAERSA